MQIFTLTLVLALAAGSLAQFAPQQQFARRTPSILRQANDISPDGQFQYSFQTEDGISADARGDLKNIGSPDGPAQSITGQFSYTGDDGQVYTVTYVADENGYRPSGAHLAQPAASPAGRTAFQAQQVAPSNGFAPSNNFFRSRA